LAVDYFTCENIALLLKWCKIVCGTYGFRVNNFTMSFSDGRAFCLLINFYLPHLLPLSEIRCTSGDLNMSSILDTTQVGILFYVLEGALLDVGAHLIIRI
jgi:hypothetical protein